MDRTFIFQSVFCLHCVYHLNLFRGFLKKKLISQRRRLCKQC